MGTILMPLSGPTGSVVAFHGLTESPKSHNKSSQCVWTILECGYNIGEVFANPVTYIANMYIRM